MKMMGKSARGLNNFLDISSNKILPNEGLA